MKKFIFFAALTGLFLFNYCPAEAISLEIIPMDQTVMLGDTVDVEIAISDLGLYSAPSLGAFQLSLSYDSSILSWSSVAFGDPDPAIGDQLDLFAFGFNPTGTSDSGGLLTLFEISLDSADDLDNLQLDNFTLATVTFDTLGFGTSALGLLNVVLSDALGMDLSASTAGGSVDVAGAPVPEPATIFLLVSGIFGMGIFGRKKLIQK